MSAGSVFPDRHGRATLARMRHDTRQLSRAIANFKDNAGYQVGNPARHLRISTTPVPPLAEYEAWFQASRSPTGRGRAVMTGSKMRRAVIMVRGGSSLADASRAVGMTHGALSKWLDKLPPELRP